jgi:hypothetical protein
MDMERSIRFPMRQLQHAFKHARRFGVQGAMTRTTLEAFRFALMRHVSSASTQVLKGSYRNLPVTHFVDRYTGLNVMRRSNGEFLSGWKLSAEQLRHVLSTGRLGGGR